MSIKKYSKYILSTSAGDPLRSKDGTSKYILTQANFANKANMGFIHLCYLKKKIKGKMLVFRFGVSIDGQYQGVYTANQVVKLIKDNGFDISEIYLNNVISANFKELGRILNAFKEAPIITMVHDFYLCCFNYALFVDGHYCNASKLGDKPCQNCEYFKKSLKMENQIWGFLSKYMGRMKFNAPSECAKEIFLRFHKEIDESKVHAIPNQNIVFGTGDSKYTKNKKLRIGYIGYENVFKGFDVFKSLTEKYKDVYDFFWFNSRGSSIPGAKTIRSGFDKDHMNGMADYVKENNIDALLLWAKGPETFSYAAVEALSSKTFMISYKDSGNIARIIADNKSGVVLNSVDALYALLDDYASLEKTVDEYRKGLEDKSISLQDNPDIVDTVDSKVLEEKYSPKLPSNVVHPLNVVMNAIMLKRYKKVR